MPAMMGQQGINYAVCLISTHFGDVVTKVCECLIRHGSLSFLEVVRFSELPQGQVKNSLLILIQHNCVQAFSVPKTVGMGGITKPITLYMVIFDNIIHRMRFSKFCLIVKEHLGNQCADILEGFLQHGRLTFELLFDRALGLSEGKATRNDVLAKFNKLVHARYVERCPKGEPFIEPKSDEEVSAIMRKCIKSSGEIRTIEQEAIIAAVPQDADRFSGISSLTMNTEGDMKDVNNTLEASAGSKRKHEVLEADEDIQNAINTTEVLWRVNYEKFVHCLKKKACVVNVRSRLGLDAAIVLEAMIDANDHQNIALNSVTLSLNSIIEGVRGKPGGISLTLERVRAILEQLGSQLCPEESGTLYTVGLKGIIETCQNDEVESLVLNKYGKDAYRVFRMLILAGRLIAMDQVNYILSFEEISLKFIAIAEQDALRTYLLRKLDNLINDDKCQFTMISTWITELYLDKINRLLLEDDTITSGNIPAASSNPEYQSIIKEFKSFLSDSRDVLDEATTMKLLESYGRVEELVFFAALKEHYEIVIHHYIQQGETKKALEILQRPNISIDLQYKFAPDLIMLDAYETVESWMTTDKLNPRKLIPAMMRYASEPHAKNETHGVIKYLEYCIHHLHNEDPGVHNLLLSLYANQEDDSALLRFLQCKFGKGRVDGLEYFYDPKYALRLCLLEKRMRACVHIYSMMCMHEEAVALALQIDPELAMAEADKVEDDEDQDLRKKLWLMVAKHVIQLEKGVKRENIRKAIAFLKETDGLLKIEDILPFFPDFALIDDFKEAICSSLEDYNMQIKILKEEMDDATHGADNIRSDITSLAQRYAVVERNEECGVCKCKILSTGGAHQVGRGYMSIGPMAPFYVFPCGHSFHAQCLIAHVTQSTTPSQAEYILEIQKQLSLIGGKVTRYWQSYQ